VINLIKIYNKDINDSEIEKIRYGLEAVYLTLTKLIAISLLAIYLNIFEEFIVFTLLYNFVRLFAFGIHAKNSLICLLLSSFIFLFFPYLASVMTSNTYGNLVMGSICVILMIIYAPADTHKRPLINKKKRIRFKMLSVGISSIYLLLALLINNDFISNCMILSLITEVILILPVTYRLFDLPYNNYKLYKGKKIY